MNIQEINNDHLTINEMIEFIGSNKITPEYAKLGTKIHSHINKCEECKKIYNTILDADDALKKLLLYIPDSEKIAFNAFRAMYVYESQKENGKEKRAEFKSLVKDIVFNVKLKIQSFSELECDLFPGMSNYYHPAFAGVPRSSKHQDAENNIIRSHLVDKDDNRISINDDQTLKLSYNKRYCNPGAVIFLIPEDDEKEIYFKETVMDDDDEDMVVAEFENIETGEYVVAIKNQ